MKIKQLAGLIIVIVAVFVYYAAVYWLGDDNLWQVELLTSMHLNKPWVYRQLVPMLARFIATFGVRIDQAIVLVVVCAGAGFYLALRKLVFVFYKPNDAVEIVIVLAVIISLILFQHNRVPYDLMTACFFTQAFLYIARNMTREYLILFPFICLNRETALLLIPFYFLVSLGKSGSLDTRKVRFMLAYQVGAYVLVQLSLRIIFADNDGASVWIEPLLNIHRFLNNPARTLLHSTITFVLFMAVIKDWHLKPQYLRLAFAYFAPLLVIEYLVIGQAFEVRVFIEMFPVLVVLIIPTLLRTQIPLNDSGITTC